jgi:hypothetical protein
MKFDEINSTLALLQMQPLSATHPVQKKFQNIRPAATRILSLDCLGTRTPHSYLCTIEEPTQDITKLILGAYGFYNTAYEDCDHYGMQTWPGWLAAYAKLLVERGENPRICIYDSHLAPCQDHSQKHTPFEGGIISVESEINLINQANLMSYLATTRHAVQVTIQNYNRFPEE